MPYAFDRIREALGRPAGPSNQSDIFAPASPGGEEEQSSDGPIVTAQDQSVAPASTGGDGPSYGGAAQAQTNTAAKNKVFERNKGRAQSPMDVQGLTGKINNATQSIQGEANNYVQGADDRFQGGPNPLDQAGIKDFTTPKEIGAEPLPYQNASTEWERLYRDGPGRVGDLELKTDTKFNDAQLLSNDAGLRELFRRQGGAEYNMGESALDAALLSRNPDFNRSREEALRSERDLRTEENKIRETARGNAQGLLDQSYGAWKDGIDTSLDSAISAIRQKALADEEAFDAGLQFSPGPDNFEHQEMVSAELERLKSLHPDLARYMRAPTDATPYFSQGMSGEDTGWQDFLSDGGSNTWNDILTLMGRGGDVPMAGKYAGKKSSDVAKDKFDTNAFSKDILDRAQQIQKTAGSRTADPAKIVRPFVEGPGPAPEPGSKARTPEEKINEEATKGAKTVKDKVQKDTKSVTNKATETRKKYLGR